MTHPVTYYVQNQPIEALIEKYGSTFQNMTRSQKLFLLSMLVDAISNGLVDFRLARPHSIDGSFVEDCIDSIGNLSQRDMEGLILAIANQLYDKTYAQ